jgi:hypothetical protein
VIVTAVPTSAVDGGDDDAVNPAHGAVDKVYWKALNASYVLGGVPPVPGLPASRAQTENR